MSKNKKDLYIRKGDSFPDNVGVTSSMTNTGATQIDTPDMILYHYGCPDGTAAALPFYISMIDKGINNKVINSRLQGVRFHEEYPSNIKGKKVVIVDFCYRRDILLRIAAEAEWLLVIDHHDTSLREVKDIHKFYPNFACIIDMKRSGAQLVWDWAYSYDEINKKERSEPEWFVGWNLKFKFADIFTGKTTFVEYDFERHWLIEIIADRDLWKWEYPFTKEIGKMLHQFSKYNFEDMYRIIKLSKKETIVLLQNIIPRGIDLLQQENKDVGYCVKNSVLCEFEGYKVRLTHCYPNLRSEVGNTLLESDDCDFAGVWRYDLKADQWWVSLRATKDSKINLSELCDRYCGGGHRRASGFAIHGPNSEEYNNASPSKRKKMAFGSLRDFFPTNEKHNNKLH